jgi:hypothetical protein
MSTRRLLWPPALCVTLALALPSAALARPSARYVLRPSSAVAGQPTTLDASPTTCDLRPCTYRWSWVLRARKGQRLRPLGRWRDPYSHVPAVRRPLFPANRPKPEAPESSKTRRIVVSEAPAPAPAPSPAPAPTAPSAPMVSLEQVDGGPGWYGQFANPLPTNPGYFPIGVWGSYNHTQASRDLDAQAGINIYVWASDSNFLDEIRADGRFRVIQLGSNRANTGSETAGWLLGDEFDMNNGVCPSSLDTAKAGLPADGRFRFTNYGKGLTALNTPNPWVGSESAAACWANGRDVTSSDTYWFTDVNERGNSRYGFGSSYGQNVTRLRQLEATDEKRQPIWSFVEAGWPNIESAVQGARAIQPPEVRSAVWHSLIGGARGILYFQHSFGGPCSGDHHVIRTNCEGTRPMVSSVNAQVKGLASVLNSPFVTSGHSATGDVKHMVKWDYVFAGADSGGGNATFSISCVGELLLWWRASPAPSRSRMVRSRMLSRTRTRSTSTGSTAARSADCPPGRHSPRPIAADPPAQRCRRRVGKPASGAWRGACLSTLDDWPFR